MGRLYDEKAGQQYLYSIIDTIGYEKETIIEKSFKLKRKREKDDVSE